jgi:hypothetical protein
MSNKIAQGPLFAVFLIITSSDLFASARGRVKSESGAESINNNTKCPSGDRGSVAAGNFPLSTFAIENIYWTILSPNIILIKY